MIFGNTVVSNRFPHKADVLHVRMRANAARAPQRNVSACMKGRQCHVWRQLQPEPQKLEDYNLTSFEDGSEGKYGLECVWFIAKMVEQSTDGEPSAPSKPDLRQRFDDLSSTVRILSLGSPLSAQPSPSAQPFLLK
jgi:hypothetical protein